MKRLLGSLFLVLAACCADADEPRFIIHTTSGRVIKASSLSYAPPDADLKIMTPEGAPENAEKSALVSLADLMAVNCPGGEASRSPTNFACKFFPGEWRLPTEIDDSKAVRTLAVSKFEVSAHQHEGEETTARFSGTLLVPVSGDWTFRAIAPDLLGLAIGADPTLVLTPETPDNTATIKLAAGQNPIILSVPANKRRIYQIEVTGPGVSSMLADLLIYPRDQNLIELTDGSRFNCTIAALSDGHLTVNTAFGQVRLAHDVISRFQPVLPQATGLLDAAGNDDLVLVGNKDRLVELKASVTGISETHLLVNHAGQQRQIELGRLAGFSRAAPAPPRPATTLRLVNGDQLHGQLAKLNAEAIELNVSWHNGTLRIPLDKIDQLLRRPPGCIFLSDLEPVEVEQRAWFGYPVPWRRNTGFQASVPQLDDQSFGHALGLHSYTRLRFPAADVDARLLAVVGIEKPAPGNTAAAVNLRIGDAIVASKPALGPDSPPWLIDVPVPAGSTIDLEVDFGDFEDIGDRVIFGNPRLLLNSRETVKP